MGSHLADEFLERDHKVILDDVVGPRDSPMGAGKTRNNAAVLVLNRDGAHFLDACFESLLKISGPAFDIYLIDNASKDASVKLTGTRYPTVRVIQNGANLGFAGAYDRVIRMLDHEYVVLLNNDTVVEEKWLEALLGPVDHDEKVAACASRIVMMSNPTILDHAGGMLTLTGTGLDLGKWRTDKEELRISREVGFGCGCSLLIRRSAYLAAGGFDPRHFMYHEDVDLCWRMRLLGYSVMYVPDSVVHHHLGGGVIRNLDNPWKTHLCQKNRLANMLKNMGTGLLLKGLAVSMTYDAVRLMRFILLGRMDLLRAIFRGYGDTLRNLKRIREQRRQVQSTRRVSDAEMSQYFHPITESAWEYVRLIRPR